MTKTNTMQDKVTSRSTSKALHEAGLDIETEFYWKKYFVNGREIIEPQRDVPEDYPERYSAYLTDELLAVMPDGIRLYKTKNRETEGYSQGVGKYSVYIKSAYLEGNTASVLKHKNPAEALGKLALWLIENDHVDVTNLNKS